MCYSFQAGLHSSDIIGKVQAAAKLGTFVGQTMWPGSTDIRMIRT